MKRTFRLEPATLDAFEAQMTEDTFRNVLEYRRRRVAMMAAMGVAVGDASALEQDAITDTLAGVAGWDPATTSLAAHLRAVIRRRSTAISEPLVTAEDEETPLPFRVERRAVFELLDFARVRLELAWRELRDQARAARAERRAARGLALDR